MLLIYIASEIGSLVKTIIYGGTILVIWMGGAIKIGKRNENLGMAWFFWAASASNRHNYL